MSIRAYAEYRDSGVPWLGSLPSHWGALPLKRIARLRTDRAAATDFQVALENIESGGVGRFVETNSEFGTDGVGFSNGDVLFGKLRPYLAKVWVADRDGEAVGDFHVLRPVRDCNSRFLFYQLASDRVIDVINGSTFGAKMPRASWDFMGQLCLARPSLLEQERIAAFLDCETAKIDALVAEQERLIALLKEKRLALISHAVTKGLDPNVPMKDSGVEWLGELPSHWQALQLGRVCRQVSDGPHFSPQYVDDGVVFLSARNISVGSWYLDDVKFISNADYLEFCKRVIPERGDVLYTKGGTTGVARVVDLEFPFQVWVHVAVLKLYRGSVDPWFVAYALNSCGCYEQSQLHTRGATNQDLGLTRLVKIWLALPPLVDQEKIVRHLDKEVGFLDAAIGESVRMCNLLVERRSSLIAAAVTGKIDVGGLA